MIRYIKMKKEKIKMIYNETQEQLTEEVSDFLLNESAKKNIIRSLELE